MHKILPVGAIVLLKDAVDSLMIIGYLPEGTDNNKKDYMGVSYPVGLTSISDVVGFNHDDIKEILFNGYDDNVLFDKFIKKLHSNNAFK